MYAANFTFDESGEWGVVYDFQDQSKNSRFISATLITRCDSMPFLPAFVSLLRSGELLQKIEQ
jgi:hypothetical protein